MAQKTTTPELGVPTEPNAEGLFDCPAPECDKSFTLQRGLVRHMNYAHDANVSTAVDRLTDEERRAAGLRSRNDAANDRAALTRARSEAVSGVRDALTDLVMPLRAQLREIDRQLQIVNVEVAALKTARTNVEVVLRRLDPTFEPVKAAKESGANGARNRQQHEERLAAVREFFDKQHDSLSDSFTANSLVENMRSNGGTKPMTITTLNRVLQELHQSGEIRLDRIVQGGGQNWKLVGRNGNG